METKIQSFIGLADFVSLMNLSCGFFSIISAVNNNFTLSATFMILSLLFDSIDGWVARKTGRIDELGFGKNIDSLSDTISFGLAPAFFIYSYTHLNTPNLEVPAILVSLFIIICGVLRLARYNVISDKVKTFIGYPIPGIAILIASFYLSGIFNIYLAFILAAIVSVAMICNVKYPKFSNKIILALNCVCIFFLILQIPLKIFNVNIFGLILFLSTVYYLISPIFTN